jgi:hypothetical protein
MIELKKITEKMSNYPDEFINTVILLSKKTILFQQEQNF